MTRKVYIFLAFLVLLAAGISIFHKSIFERVLSSAIGTKVVIKNIALNPYDTSVTFRDFRVMNPQGFPAGQMAYFPEIYINFDLNLLFQKKIHIRSLRVHIADIQVIRKKEGALNIHSVKQGWLKDPVSPVKEVQVDQKGARSTDAGEVFDVQIDKLWLKIDKITRMSYAENELTKIGEKNLRMEGTFTNIKDAGIIIRLIKSQTQMNVFNSKV